MDTDKIRTILNMVFLVLAAIAVIMYFAGADFQTFFYVGIAAITAKLIEFFLRFMF